MNSFKTRSAISTLQSTDFTNKILHEALLKKKAGEGFGCFKWNFMSSFLLERKLPSWSPADKQHFRASFFGRPIFGSGVANARSCHYIGQIFILKFLDRTKGFKHHPALEVGSLAPQKAPPFDFLQKTKEVSKLYRKVYILRTIE